MPDLAYKIPGIYLVIVIVLAVEMISLMGLFITRRFILPRLGLKDGVNEAVSGTVQAIGVFYGITVGLIAVGVWNTHTAASDMVSGEAAAIGALWRDSSGFPSPVRERLQSQLRDYTHVVIEQVWPEQTKGKIIDNGTLVLMEYQNELFSYKPADLGDASLKTETLRDFSALTNARRLRIDAVSDNLSGEMWWVIWLGAALSIGTAYLYRIEDWKVHALLIALMAGFVALVIFMISINDRPFFGQHAISPAPYQLVLERLIDLPNQ